MFEPIRLRNYKSKTPSAVTYRFPLTFTALPPVVFIGSFDTWGKFEACVSRRARCPTRSCLLPWRCCHQWCWWTRRWKSETEPPSGNNCPAPSLDLVMWRMNMHRGELTGLKLFFLRHVFDVVLNTCVSSGTWMSWCVLRQQPGRRAVTIWRGTTFKPVSTRSTWLCRRSMNVRNRHIHVYLHPNT